MQKISRLKAQPSPDPGPDDQYTKNYNIVPKGWKAHEPGNQEEDNTFPEGRKKHTNSADRRTSKNNTEESIPTGWKDKLIKLPEATKKERFEEC